MVPPDLPDALKDHLAKVIRRVVDFQARLQPQKSASRAAYDHTGFMIRRRIQRMQLSYEIAAKG